MIGSVIIDGIDIFSAYNAIMLKGSDVDLLRLPSRREPDAVSYFETTGIEVDLDEVVLYSTDVEMKFNISATSSHNLLRSFDSFYRLLTATGYRTVYVRSLNRTYQLRYVSSSDYNQKGPLSKYGSKSAELTVRFANDNPEQMYDQEFVEPSAGVNQTYVVIAGKDLSCYNIIVNNIYTTALALPARKAPLTSISEHVSGSYADLDSNVTYEAFDVVISCQMMCANIAEYYNNISALFARLCSDNLVELSLPAAKKKYRCYYSKQDNLYKVRAFNPSVFLKFDIVLKSTDFKLVTYLLGTTDGKAILTTDNKLIALQ